MSIMDVKGGTQTYSTPKDRSDEVTKFDNTQSLSAADKDKFFEGKDVGEVLNKLADPNYVNPAKKMRSVGNSQLDKDSFLKLLLAQMKNQDPTNPLKSHEMAAQLAQFTSLEKLTNIDQSIEGLRKDQAPLQSYESLNLIGKAVSSDSSKIIRSTADEAHNVRFNLPQDAQKAKVEIKDASGAVVRTLELASLKQGRNEINWNGMLEDGSKANPGEYSASIEAHGSNGRKLAVETKFDGIIDGVQFTAQGPMLTIGKQQLRLSDVSKIVDPNFIQQAPVQTVPLQAGPQAQMPTQMMPIPQKNKSEVKPEEKQHKKAASGTIEDIAMNRGLINKLNKEGAKINTGG